MTMLEHPHQVIKIVDIYKSYNPLAASMSFRYLLIFRFDNQHTKHIKEKHWTGYKPHGDTTTIRSDNRTKESKCNNGIPKATSPKRIFGNSRCCNCPHYYWKLI